MSMARKILKKLILGLRSRSGERWIVRGGQITRLVSQRGVITRIESYPGVDRTPDDGREVAESGIECVDSPGECAEK
jgi:hypothetical protein